MASPTFNHTRFYPSQRIHIAHAGLLTTLRCETRRLSERLGRPGHPHEQARERNETDEHLAERLVQDWMNTAGWTEAQLAARAKGDAEKAWPCACAGRRR